MKALLGMMLGTLLLACAAPTVTVTPTPTPVGPPGTPVATPTAPPPILAADQLAPPPPQAVQDALLGQARMPFVPLSDMQLASVNVTVETAERIALASGPRGYGTKGSVFTWSKVGCVFLGWYTHPGMPSVGYVPPTFPAYLVQILAPPVPGWGTSDIEVVVVNAQTGERDTIYGAGAPPSGIMGTTCGVTP